MQFALDPAVLGPPADGDIGRWTKQIDEVSRVVGDPDITATCAKMPRDIMIGSWWSDWEDCGGPSNFEYARMAEEVSARVAGDVASPLLPPLVDGVMTNPRYVEERLGPEGIKTWEAHLGEVACATRDGGDVLGLLSGAQSWDQATDHVLVEGQVLGRQDEDDDLVEGDESDGPIREFLERSSRADAIYARCLEQPCSLMTRLGLGIRAMYRVEFEGDPDKLRFEIGPGFQESVLEMNYPHLSANARKCLRVMTLIAAGRGDTVEGHEERVSQGGNSKTLRVDGDAVMRAYISNRTPNAHRLFWIRREKPVLLNVAGHEGRPAV